MVKIEKIRYTLHRMHNLYIAERKKEERKKKNRKKEISGPSHYVTKDDQRSSVQSKEWTKEKKKFVLGG